MILNLPKICDLSGNTCCRSHSTHTHTHTHGHPEAISQATPSKQGLFLPPFAVFLLKNPTPLIISSLAYHLLGKRCNCSTEGKKVGGKGGAGCTERKRGVDRNREDFCHFMKNSFPFGRNFTGHNQAVPRRCNRGKSSQHLLIIFLGLLRWVRGVSSRCHSPVMERCLYLSPGTLLSPW